MTDDTDDIPLEEDLGRAQAQEFYAGMGVALGQMLQELKRQADGRIVRNVERVVERSLESNGVTWVDLGYGKGFTGGGNIHQWHEDFDLKELTYLHPKYLEDEVDLTGVKPDNEVTDFAPAQALKEVIAKQPTKVQAQLLTMVRDLKAVGADEEDIDNAVRHHLAKLAQTAEGRLQLVDGDNEESTPDPNDFLDLEFD